MSSKSRGVVYFTCLSGRSYLSLGERLIPPSTSCSMPAKLRRINQSKIKTYQLCIVNKHNASSHINPARVYCWQHWLFLRESCQVLSIHNEGGSIFCCKNCRLIQKHLMQLNKPAELSVTCLIRVSSGDRFLIETWLTKHHFVQLARLSHTQTQKSSWRMRGCGHKSHQVVSEISIALCQWLLDQPDGASQ